MKVGTHKRVGAYFFLTSAATKNCSAPFLCFVQQLAEHLLGGDAFLHGRGGNPRQNIAGAQFPRLIQHVPH